MKNRKITREEIYYTERYNLAMHTIKFLKEFIKSRGIEDSVIERISDKFISYEQLQEHLAELTNGIRPGTIITFNEDGTNPKLIPINKKEDDTEGEDTTT